MLIVFLHIMNDAHIYLYKKYIKTDWKFAIEL